MWLLSFAASLNAITILSNTYWTYKGGSVSLSFGQNFGRGKTNPSKEKREKKVCFLSQQGAFLEAFLVLLMHRINLGRSALAPSPKGSFGLGLTMLGLLVRSNTCKQLPFLDITEYIKIRVSNFVICMCKKRKKLCFQQNSNNLKLFNKSYK